MANREQIILGRDIIEIYRNSHQSIHDNFSGNELLDKHTEIYNIMINNLINLSFIDLTDFYSQNNELNKLEETNWR
jgi:hypothetical protein